MSFFIFNYLNAKINAALDVRRDLFLRELPLVEAMHAPHFLLIFKISEVRHLDVSVFSPIQGSWFICLLKANQLLMTQTFYGMVLSMNFQNQKPRSLQLRRFYFQCIYRQKQNMYGAWIYGYDVFDNQT